MRKPLNLFNRLVLFIDLTPSRDWRANALNLADWQRWDSACRTKLGWRAGLSFFHRTSDRRRWLIASRHWPHRLCWDWYLALTILSLRQAKLALIIDRPRRFWSCDLLFLSLSWCRQSSEWMAASGPARNTAPKIRWAHHLMHAEPMGNA